MYLQIYLQIKSTFLFGLVPVTVHISTAVLMCAPTGLFVYFVKENTSPLDSGE